MADNTVNGGGFALGLHAGRNNGFIFLPASQPGGTSFPASDTSGRTGGTSGRKNFIPRLVRHAPARAGRTSDMTGPAPGLTEGASGVSGCVPAVTRCTSNVVEGAPDAIRCVSHAAEGTSTFNGCAPHATGYTSSLVGCVSNIVRCVSGVAGDVSDVDRCIVFSYLRNFTPFGTFPRRFTSTKHKNNQNDGINKTTNQNQTYG